MIHLKTSTTHLITILLLALSINNIVIAQTNETYVLDNINPSDYTSNLSTNDITLEMGSRVAFKTKKGTTGIIEVIDINIKRYLRMRIKIGTRISHRELVLKQKNPFQTWAATRYSSNQLRNNEKIQWGNLDLDTHNGIKSSNFNNQPSQDFFIKNFPEGTYFSIFPSSRILRGTRDSVPIIDIDPRTGEVTRRSRTNNSKFILQSRNGCTFFDIKHNRKKSLFGVYIPLVINNPLLQPNRNKDKIFYLNSEIGQLSGFYETRGKTELKFVTNTDISRIGKAGVVFKYQGVSYYLTDKFYSNSTLDLYKKEQPCGSKQWTRPEGTYSADMDDISNRHLYRRDSYIREIKIEHEGNNFARLIGYFGDHVVVGRGRFRKNQKIIDFRIGTVPWREKSLGNTFDNFKISIETQNKIKVIFNPTSRILDVQRLTFQKPGNLCGWVDMHTHPMSYLGFGKKVFFGTPDTNLTLPSGYIGCNEERVTFDNIHEGLGNCNNIHGGRDFFIFDCRNDIRKFAIEEADKNFNHDNHEYHVGAPSFTHWPARRSVTHQQMYKTWLHRAYKSGLRVMVALTVNNKLLAKIVDGDEPYDDQSVSDIQTTEMIRMVNNNNSWMEVALSSEDLTRIVSEDKLAIVLGIEIDQIGNWGVNNPPTEDQVTSEINRLYDQGIRYVFPIHLVDNAFGGAAVYDDLFNIANIHYNNQPFELVQNPNVVPTGRANSKGLSDIGKFAIKEMIKKGMMIDIDHMSEQSIDSLQEFMNTDIIGNYPLNAGHNCVRHSRSEAINGNIATDERAILEDHLANLVFSSGGLLGLGTSDDDDDYTPSRFIDDYNKNFNIAWRKNAIAIGTDVNGFGMLPNHQDEVYASDWYETNFITRSTTGSQTWDYTTKGVAHYGLMYEFLYDVGSRNEEIYDNMFLTTGGFFNMWSKCEDVAEDNN